MATENEESQKPEPLGAAHAFTEIRRVDDYIRNAMNSYEGASLYPIEGSADPDSFQSYTKYQLDQMRYLLSPLVHKYEGDTALSEFNDEWRQRFASDKPLSIVDAGEAGHVANCPALHFLQQKLRAVETAAISQEREEQRAVEAAAQKERKGFKRQVQLTLLGAAIAIVGGPVATCAVDSTTMAFSSAPERAVLAGSLSGAGSVRGSGLFMTIECTPDLDGIDVVALETTYAIQVADHVEMPVVLGCFGLSADRAGKPTARTPLIEIRLSEETNELPELDVSSLVPPAPSPTGAGAGSPAPVAAPGPTGAVQP